jgi:hypothetical protein
MVGFMNDTALATTKETGLRPSTAVAPEALDQGRDVGQQARRQQILSTAMTTRS